MTDYYFRYREWLEAYKGQPMSLHEITPYNQGIYRSSNPEAYLDYPLDYFKDLGCGVAIARKVNRWYELRVSNPKVIKEVNFGTSLLISRESVGDSGSQTRESGSH